ncbi:MAG: hypothetical protein AAB210_02045 [Deltaproteobacteria bacterium]
MFRTVLIVLFVLISCSPSAADKEARPYPYVATANNGRFYFKMSPDPNDPNAQWDLGKGYGTLFEINNDGTEKALWKVEGWYAFTTYISNDGKYLVRMNIWPGGQEPSDEHLAIAFYKNGKLLKSYSTKDLIKNPSVIRPMISHYSYLKKIVGFEEPYNYRFTIQTVDNIEYVFDASNGMIVSRKNLQK